jgi:hypothetical protein
VWRLPRMLGKPLLCSIIAVTRFAPACSSVGNKQTKTACPPARVCLRAASALAPIDQRTISAAVRAAATAAAAAAVIIRQRLPLLQLNVDSPQRMQTLTAGFRLPTPLGCRTQSTY